MGRVGKDLLVGRQRLSPLLTTQTHVCRPLVDPTYSGVPVSVVEVFGLVVSIPWTEKNTDTNLYTKCMKDRFLLYGVVDSTTLQGVVLELCLHVVGGPSYRIKGRGPARSRK